MSNAALMDMFNFGSGGGLIGQDRDVVLNNFRFKVHSFQELGPDKQTVINTYPPSCVLAVDITVEGDVDDEKYRHSEQFYPIDSVPTEFGGKPRKAGGYMPTQDQEHPAQEGPWFLGYNRTNVWTECAYAIFFREFKGLTDEVKQKIMAEGIGVLSGIRVHLGAFIRPAGEKKLKEDPQAKGTTILTVEQVNQWPWESTPAATPVPTAATGATAATAEGATGKKGPGRPKGTAATAAAPAGAVAVPVAAAVPAVPTAPAGAPSASSASSASVGNHPRTVEVIQQTIRSEGGSVLQSVLLGKVFGVGQAMSLGGDDLQSVMTDANDQNVIAMGMMAGAWKFDPTTKTLSL